MPKINHAKDFKDFKQKQLARIHIIKKELGLDDDAYRRILKRIGNVESSTDLTALGRARLLKHLEECKFVLTGERT